MTKKKRKTTSSLIDAYKRVRKPAAPPERIIPDKRDKLKENEGYEDYEEYKESKNPARANVFASGYVQGVYFRSSAQEKAVAARLTGWVRNRADGRVEAVFEGDKDAIQRVIDWFHKGPPAARVESVEVFWENATGEFTGFEQRHTF